VLDDTDASHVLYDIDAVDEPAETAKLAAGVRARVRAANQLLAATDLRPTTACDVRTSPANDGDLGAFECAPSQQLTCGALVAERRGDVLSWRVGTETGATKLGWSIAPMSVGDGPPKEMVTCIEEAHFDPVAARIAARIEHACKGGGGDACVLPDEWRVAALR